MFGRKKQNAEKAVFTGKPDKEVRWEESNPWLNARKEWNAHEGGVIRSRRMWQLVGVLSLLISLACIGGITLVGMQSKFVPYVVAVDKIGHAVAYARADVAKPADTRVITACLASFIDKWRFVTPDIDVQRKAVLYIYNFMLQTDPARVKIDAYYSDKVTSPFERAAKETVDVTITSIIPQSKDTWQIDWNEDTYDRKGEHLLTDKYRAFMQIQIIPPTTKTSEEMIHKNPIGLFIKEINWSKRFEQ